jgi:hypothetical protein
MGEDLAELLKGVKYNHRNGKPKLVKISKESETKVFASAGVAARHFGLTGGAITYFVKYNKMFDGYKFEFITDPGEHHVINDVVITRVPKRKPRKVFVREKGSETIQAWPSLESFAREVGQKKDTLQKSIYVKKGWGKYEIWYV